MKKFWHWPQFHCVPYKNYCVYQRNESTIVALSYAMVVSLFKGKPFPNLVTWLGWCSNHKKTRTKMQKASTASWGNLNIWSRVLMSVKKSLRKQWPIVWSPFCVLNVIHKSHQKSANMPRSGLLSKWLEYSCSSFLEHAEPSLQMKKQAPGGKLP